MKELLAAITVIGTIMTAAPALANDQFICIGEESNATYTLTVVDQGDQEGAVEVKTASTSTMTYADYRISGNQHRFVFGFDLYNEGQISKLNLITIAANDLIAFVQTNYATEIADCSRSEAPEASLTLTLNKIDQAYQLGNDNNYLSYKLHTADLPSSDALRVLSTNGQLAKSLKECVFMKSGAYGEHINTSTQKKLVGMFFTKMKKLALETDGNFKYYRATGIASIDDIFNTPCSLLIREKNGAYIVLDGHSFD